MDLTAQRKREVELLAVMACYGLFYLTIVGPFLGAVAGFEQSAIPGDGYGFSLSDVLTPRGMIFLLSTIAVLMTYIQVRPKLSGMAAKDYWNP